jgi:hypothetical protein
MQRWHWRPTRPAGAFRDHLPRYSLDLRTSTTTPTSSSLLLGFRASGMERPQHETPTAN